MTHTDVAAASRVALVTGCSGISARVTPVSKHALPGSGHTTHVLLVFM